MSNSGKGGLDKKLTFRLRNKKKPSDKKVVNIVKKDMTTRNKWSRFQKSTPTEPQITPTDTNIGQTKFKTNEGVKYNIAICIPSHERYNKIKRLLGQFFTQKTSHNFHIIILNDGSSDVRYSELVEIYPRITYIKNPKPNGKLNHWFCYNQMWCNLKLMKPDFVLQMDDDFILCDGFLDKIVKIYIDQAAIDDKVVGVAPHLWSFRKNSGNEHFWGNKHFADGILLLNFHVIKLMNFSMNPVGDSVTRSGVPVGAWPQINRCVKDNNLYYYKTKESLVYHDGNNDSQLHPTHRDGKQHGMYSQKLEPSLLKYKE